MLTVIKDNKFTGVQYIEESNTVYSHHYNQSELLVDLEETLADISDKADGEVALPIYRDPTEDEITAAHIIKINRERYQKEVADLEYDGMIFSYDRESRALLDSAGDKIRRGIVSSVRWTCKNGWYDLTKDNIDALEVAGALQVQEAFDWAEEQIKAIGDINE